MNRVESLSASLEDCRRDLSGAKTQLATHETLLEQATQELQASNGDLEIWQTIDQKVRFETRQVERYTSLAAQYQANVTSAEQALLNAQREATVQALRVQADLGNYNHDVAPDVAELLDCLERAAQAAGRIDQRWAQVVAGNDGLRALSERGVDVGLTSRLAPALLAVLERNPVDRVMCGPDWKPSSWDGLKGIETRLSASGLAGFISVGLFAHEPIVPADVAGQYRAQIRARLTPPAPAHVEQPVRAVVQRAPTELSDLA